jgi:hypothetical protein
VAALDLVVLVAACLLTAVGLLARVARELLRGPDRTP